MKAIAASSIGQYQESVIALSDYYRGVELGLGECLRQAHATPLGGGHEREAATGATGTIAAITSSSVTGAIVFGSDQGLVGRFNEVIADYAANALASLRGPKIIWAVGERVHTYLSNRGLTPVAQFQVPSSVAGITPLVSTLQIASEATRGEREDTRLYLFHNRPTVGALYEPVSQRLLPLDATWERSLLAVPWPTKCVPDLMESTTTSLRALVREYLFIAAFRACAESLASENASRLAAMQRADKNIDDSMEKLQRRFHRLRQSDIDEELFDVVSGFEALAK